jgi:curli biogenesis system outer membrane secretion channel CsgG
MRNFLNSILILLLAGGLAAAQTTTAKPTLAKPAEKLGTHATANLPSEATVDAFLHQQFGYEPDLSWKISSIRPTGVAGLAEVSVVLATPQGPPLSRDWPKSMLWSPTHKASK